MDSARKKVLVASIAQFLEKELKENPSNVDFVESIEVAVQCIRTSYELGEASDTPDLAESFFAGCDSRQQQQQQQQQQPISAEAKASAEKLKAEGNRLINENKFLEAVNAYTKAIQLDPGNAVYYCNRAAAYSKVNDHEAAIRDCELALARDPSYSKAHGRQGFAYAAMKNHARAAECYESALRLEPSNASYQQNLDTARSALAAEGGGGVGGGGGGGGGLDFSSLLNNPQMINMASQMMQSPQMQQMMAGMMGQQQPQQPQQQQQQPQQQQQQQQPDMQSFMRMGQQFVSQMRGANPELAETLQRQFAAASGQQQQPEQQQQQQRGNNSSDSEPKPPDYYS